jgi:hypothetical protein
MNMKTTPELQLALMEFYQASAALDYLVEYPGALSNEAEKRAWRMKREEATERRHAAKAEVQYQIIRADPELQAIGASPQLARMVPQAWAALHAFYDAGVELLKAMQGSSLVGPEAKLIIPRYQACAQAMALTRDALHLNSKTNGTTR